MKALLFGAIGTLVETSELQRRAYNAAFAESDLEWAWSRATYADLLQSSGGQKRIEQAAKRAGLALEPAEIHRRKSLIFQDMLRKEHLTPRPGVVETISAAQAAGLALGFVTTTSRENVDAILWACRIPSEVFTFIGDASMVTAPKPAADIYMLALSSLGVRADQAIAIEDSPDERSCTKRTSWTPRYC